ncbi:MAG: DMT family transporter [Ilumatobacteraceae bacterium]
MQERTTGMAQAGAAMAMVGGAVTASGFLTSFPLFSAQAVRYALAAILLFVVARRWFPSAIRRPAGREWWWLAASATAGLSGYNLAVLAAVEHAEPAAIGTVVACVPLVLALAVPLTQRRPPPLRLVGAALAVVIGAAIVQGGGRTDLAGLLWSLLALAGEAGFTLLAMPVLSRLGPFTIAFTTAWLAALELFMLAVVFDGSSSLAVPDAGVVLAVGYLVLASAGAFVLWFLAIERVGGALTGLAAGVIPIAAAVTGLMVGRTTIDLSVLGGTVVVASGIVVGIASTRSDRVHRAAARRAVGVDEPADDAAPAEASRIVAGVEGHE